VAQNPDTGSVATRDDINACFPTKQEKRYYRGGESLPMYGEINGWAPAGAYTCRMIRAVAKVQIQLGPSFVAELPSDFNENVEWCIVFVPPAGFVQPKSTLAGVPGVLTFSNGYLNWTPSSSNFLQKHGAPEANKTVYIYEFQSSIHKINDTINPIDRDKWYTARPFLLLTKRYGIGIGGNYRLEFYDHVKKEYLDLKRNHLSVHNKQS
jgi:hypothetical protein